MSASVETKAAVKQILLDMTPYLDEKQRRILFGSAANALGHGGISFVITPAIKHCHRGHWNHQVLDRVRESGDQSMTGRASGFETVMS